MRLIQALQRTTAAEAPAQVIIPAPEEAQDMAAHQAREEAQDTAAHQAREEAQAMAAHQAQAAPEAQEEALWMSGQALLKAMQPQLTAVYPKQEIS